MGEPVEQHCEKLGEKFRASEMMMPDMNSFLINPDIDIFGFGMTILVTYLAGYAEFVGMTNGPLHRRATADKVAIAGGPVIGQSIARGCSNDRVNISKVHDCVLGFKAFILKLSRLRSWICDFFLFRTGCNNQSNDYQSAKDVPGHGIICLLGTNVYILFLSYFKNRAILN